MLRVAFVTLNRSDYATLRPVLHAALDDDRLEPTLIVGGSHLLARQGATIREIRDDGFEIAEQLDFLHEDDDGDAALAEAQARAALRFAAILRARAPDRVFIVGDRWEMLPVAMVCHQARIPLAHHSGGDLTQGSADNQTRFALSQLAHLHQTALPEHAERLMRLGEEPWRVSVTGEPALAHLVGARPTQRQAACALLGLDPSEAFVLATLHAGSFEAIAPERPLALFLEALDGLAAHGDTVLLTAPNPDAGGGDYAAAMQAAAARTPRIRLVENLGAERYHAALSAAAFMIGNSSSGLLEAPSFALPAVNLGRRQDGRHRAANVIDAPFDAEAIAAAIATARSAAFRASLEGMANPYVRADAARRILDSVAYPADRATLLAKLFIDPLAAARSRA